jgi:Skp family chaperone for outer membrane proteins
MQRLWAYSAALVGGAGVAWCLGTGSGSAAAVADAPPRSAKAERVAFVDVDEVFEKYFKKDELYKEMDKSLEELRKQMMAADAQLRDLQKEAQGTVQTREKQLPILTRMADIKAQQTRMRDLAEFQLMWREQEGKKTIRADIVAEVQALAAEQGFSLVLNRAVVVDMPAANGQPSQPQRRSVVVYSEPQHNLTDAVLARLNKKSNAPPQPKP